MSGRGREGVVRFLIAGGSASALNWLLRIGLSVFTPFGAAVVLAQIAGMIAGFLMYRLWVFRGARTSLATQLIGFVIVNGVTLIVVFFAALAGRALLLQMGAPVMLAEGTAHAIAIGLGAVTNFLGHREISFRRLAAISP